MDQLIAKIGNLGYEILGIFFPGLVLILFSIFGWWSIGPMASVWSQGFLPEAQIKEISGFLSVLNESVQFGMLAFILTIAYFCGHALHWISRGGPRLDSPGPLKRLGLSLIFKVPKPKADYHSPLDPVFKDAKAALGFADDASWREYYPVAKSFLAKNLQSSLAPVFQNKYTLHRSLALAAVVWFWGGVVAMLISLLMVCLGGFPPPKWIPLGFSIPISASLVIGFSGSYSYNWLLWGDTLISEVYMYKKVKDV
ncbi:hypothetical protein KWH29_01195 [Xanthomonas campestris pv. paulliniae]|uniref:hypothetical protein n=1 Tax=Xanthomonas euvesicatoria TaxID=456327 RepID=UPI001C4968F3|nr:hypothetical protein [Xanthomonas euvesicatoria]MBV6843977.1 hypothetical protein [Xanthomonas campestris pv. paulliniae]